MKSAQQQKLKLVLPKGSLQEATLTLFRHAGFEISAVARSYFISIDDPAIEAVMLRAQEIPRYVEMGAFDVGISGKDWIMENKARVVEVSELIYAKQGLRPVKIVLAVPENSPVKSVRDLQGKRIATELVTVTRGYLKKHGVTAEVEFSYGATEIKAGQLVDAIVEITETGSTLFSHHLRIVDVVMESTPRLIANRQAWQNRWKREKIENLALLLEGALVGERKVGLKMNVRKNALAGLLEILPAMKKPTISQLTDPDWCALETIVDREQAKELIPRLKKLGAQGIVEYPLHKVIY
ncbi:MAG TPA: ATP phosphoribosyltransferase [bacterium]|nr:ATP phosphoribosyltransferase [bacterium]HOL66040.1 ATP phosphoribosyltransferase [bacterium]